MRDQNFLGHKNLKPRLSDQFRTSEDRSPSALRDSFYSLLKSEDSRRLRKNIEILRRLDWKKSRFQDCFAKNLRPLDTKNHPKNKTVRRSQFSINFCQSLIFVKTIHHPLFWLAQIGQTRAWRLLCFSCYTVIDLFHQLRHFEVLGNFENVLWYLPLSPGQPWNQL